MIDLVRLRHERDSIVHRKSSTIVDIHDAKASLEMLGVYAEGLANSNSRYAKLVTANNIAHFLKMANAVGLHTGWREKQ